MTNEEKKVTDNSDDELLDPNDFEESEVSEDESVEVEEEKEETKDKNAYYAQKRREQEAKAKEKSQTDIIEKERQDAYLKGKLDATKVNKFTDEPIEDEYDLEIYELQLELDKQGKDPINDLGAELAKRNRSKKLAEAEQLKAKETEQEKIKQEIAKFKESYPNVNVSELSKDEDYVKYAENKFGRWTLEEIYEGYLKVKKAKASEEQERSAGDNAKQLANKRSKVPSSNPVSQPTLNKSVSEMTDEEFREYWKKKYGS